MTSSYYLVGERNGTVFTPDFRVPTTVSEESLRDYCRVQGGGFTQCVFRPIADGSWTEVPEVTHNYFLCDLAEMFNNLGEYL